MTFDIDLLNRFLLSKHQYFLPLWMPKGQYSSDADRYFDRSYMVSLLDGSWHSLTTSVKASNLVELFADGAFKSPDEAAKELSEVYRSAIVVFKEDEAAAGLDSIELKLPDVTLDKKPGEIAGALIEKLEAKPELLLRRNKEGAPLKTLENAAATLSHLQSEVWFDDFYQRIFVKDETGKVREWTDVDDINLTIYVQSCTPLRSVSEQLISRALISYAMRRQRNEPREWLESIRWDGKPRINDLLTTGFGALPSDYVAAASKNFMLSMVARIYQPGCKVDNMLVLEGEQGKGKSSALSVLGQPWFMESTEIIGTIDFLQSLQGKLLVEIAELDSFGKADARTIKKTVTCRIDRYRASYGRHTKDYPRQCVFVGTTNEDEYLEDPTGGRRFWPIRVKNIKLDWIFEEREQLFAEAVARYKQGESWWEMPKSAGLEQAQRRRKDAWEDKVVAWINGIDLTANDTFSLIDIAHKALRLEPRDIKNAEQQRLGKIMKSLGAERKHSKAGNVWRVKPLPEDIREEVTGDFPQLSDAAGNVVEMKKR